MFKGLFEILDKFDNNTIVENNTLTRYFEECDRYLVEVDNNPDTYEEEQKYFNGTEMRMLARTLSDRLQLNVSDLTSGGCNGLHGQWRIQDLPWNANLLFEIIFAENRMKMKKLNWEGRASLAPT